jgi:hypothetical protein
LPFILLDNICKSNRIKTAITNSSRAEKLEWHLTVNLITHEEGIMDMKDLIKEITAALVDNPEQIQIMEVEGDKTSVIELRVARTDFGKVIGKKGRTAQAIRTILSAASAKLGKRAILEILE